MEFSMRNQISFAALGFALVVGTSAANAETVITREIVDQPVETVITQQPDGTFVTQQSLAAPPVGTVVTQPVQTVRTVETVRTTRPVRRTAHSVVRRQIVTTRRTIVSERVIPPQPVVAPAIADATYPQPLYDVATPVLTAPPAVAEPVFGEAPVAPAYRYVYEPDRILVIDPSTNIAVQAIPR
jgi:hypothetical protein